MSQTNPLVGRTLLDRHPRKHTRSTQRHGRTAASDSDSDRVSEPPGDLVADGGVDWTDITAFQRDVLFAIASHGEGCPYGSQIKGCLDEEYGDAVVRSRLYQALDSLVVLGLVRKRNGTVDARTNYYALTDDAIRLIEDHTQRCMSVVGFDVPTRLRAKP